MMNDVNNDGEFQLRGVAREMLGEVWEKIDARAAVGERVKVDEGNVTIGKRIFDVSRVPPIYAVALGKAGYAMAMGIDETLGDYLRGGVVSAPSEWIAGGRLSKRWQIFGGGHPTPNEHSLAAARAAEQLLSRMATRAETETPLVVFLVSGGGSAMMELPSDARITLADLQAFNRTLVGCGATINEINIVRRRVSRIKGGGLSRLAAGADQVTFIISDTNAGDERSVASGVTYDDDHTRDMLRREAFDVARRYDLTSRLPATIMHALNDEYASPDMNTTKRGQREFHVLLDTATAIEAATTAARARGFVVETAHDIVEADVIEGTRALVARLAALREHTAPERVACLISGGEFSCPVRGEGIGGRNAEAALRCAIEFDERASSNNQTHFIALHAGTDGIDGNSPAAGAIADETTLARAGAINLNAHDYLARSDAHTFFHRLDDAIMTGATGTNVRDVRIMLAAHYSQNRLP